MTAAPFLAWAGAKPWLVERHAHYLPVPAPGGVYREWFLGGGSVFFLHYSTHRPAVLSDINDRLVDTYVAVRDHVEALIGELARHPYEQGHYYEVRRRLNSEPDAPLVQRAAWFLVINRHGYNGLYRENRKGGCNVPFGDHTNPRFDVGELRRASAALQGVEVRRAPAAEGLREVRAGDAVFLDPPYVPMSKTASFTSYSAAGFGPAEQKALVADLRRLNAVGARWCLTNSDTPETRELYAPWHVASVPVSRNINSDAAKRGDVSELIVTNYPVTVPPRAQLELFS